MTYTKEQMREIKFRAWNSKDNEMIMPNRGNYVLELDGVCSFVQWGEKYFRGMPELILLQFTGLKDKNGKNIYEGDIVKVKNPYGRKRFSKLYPKYLNGVVKNDKGWNFYIGVRELVKEEFGFQEVQHLNPSEEDMEVLGNIYENKELSKENEN